MIFIPNDKVRLMLDDWPFGGFMCSFVPFTQSVSVFVSSFTMTAIAVDRYQVRIYSGYSDNEVMTLLQVISTPLHTRGRAEFSDGYWKLVLIWCVAL